MRHWRSRLSFGPLDGSISTSQSIDVDGLASEQTLGTGCDCIVTVPKTAKLGIVPGTIPRYWALWRGTAASYPRYRRLPRCLNFPMCLLVDKGIWNLLQKAITSRSQRVPAGSSKRSRSYDSRLVGLAGWQGWAMAQCAPFSSSALRRFGRHRPLSSCRNDNKCGGFWPGASCWSARGSALHPARVSLHRHVPGVRWNLDLFQRSRARREVEIKTVDLPICWCVVAEVFHLISQISS